MKYWAMTRLEVLQDKNLVFSMRRGLIQKFKDFVTFPLRALTLFTDNKWGLSALRSERFDYVAREVTGYCLDVGCGTHNVFINRYLNGNGKGIDIFPYDGLSDENIVEDLTKFPFDDATFDSVTFIANLNHIPKSMRDIELAEAHRCLRTGGNIIITMGNPMAEILVHKIVWWHDNVFGTDHDLDTRRGMHAEEEFYVKDSQILERLERAGFENISKKYFLTQWGLNHLFTGWKKTT